MSEYQANMDLVRDQDTQDRQHLKKVVENDNRAAAALAAYKARQQKKYQNTSTGG